MVLGERRLEKRLGAKDDDADTIPFAPVHEVIEDELDHVETADAGAIRIEHILGVHRTRQVNGEHEVPRRFDFFDRRLDELWPSERRDRE